LEPSHARAWIGGHITRDRFRRNPRARAVAGRAGPCLRAAALTTVVAIGVVAFGRSGPDVGAHERAAKVAAVRPSIVIILADDQPTQTLWAMPRTERLLAAHGVKFTSFYDSVALCCPARSALLTGRYAHSTSIYGNAPPLGGSYTFRHRGDDAETLAVWLHRAGYRTGLFGKYLNGYRGGFVPPGWDTFTTSARYWGGPGYEQGALRHYPFTTYMPDYMGTRTAQFIRTTPAGRPLFAYYSPYAPHANPSPEPRYGSLHVCWHCHGWPTPDFNERGVSDKPPFERRPPLTRPDRTAVRRFRRLQVRTLKSVDTKVGRIVAALSDTGRLHNTIIVFMSDNGVMWGSHRWSPTAKRNPYRRASHVPLVIRYDALGRTSRIESRLVGNVDVAPTLADLAGVPTPASVDGTSFAPILRDPSRPWVRTLLLENLTRVQTPGRVPSYCGVRTDRFLFVHYAKGIEELYDERRDPFELHNIAGTPAAEQTEARLRQTTSRLCTPRPPGFTF
jgi:N-acetylglucosamine-6-sulfatase